MPNEDKIIDLARKIDQFIAALRVDGKPVTTGMAAAAIAVVLASKPKTETELDSLTNDVLSAVRAAYSLRGNN